MPPGYIKKQVLTFVPAERDATAVGVSCPEVRIGLQSDQAMSARQVARVLDGLTFLPYENVEPLHLTEADVQAMLDASQQLIQDFHAGIEPVFQ